MWYSGGARFSGSIPPAAGLWCDAGLVPQGLAVGRLVGCEGIGNFQNGFPAGAGMASEVRPPDRKRCPAGGRLTGGCHRDGG